MIKPARVIAVAMRDNCEIELLQVDTLRIDIMREDVSVVASIKQDALAAIFDERRKPPVFGHR